MTKNTDPAGLSSSLPTREQIADVLASHYAWGPADEEDREAADAVLALLSQPTPSAEPPRIEDMAPGTTFYGASEEYSAVKYLVRRHNGRTVLWSETLFQAVEPSDIDPSTIRDVTPPATESTK